MIIIIFSSIFALVALGYAGFVVYKKIPDLKNLDLATLPDEKKGEVKRKILEAKLNRNNEKLKNQLAKFFNPKKEIVLEKISRFKDWVVSLEAKYHPEHQAKPKTVTDLFEQADQFLAKEEYTEAEKCLIEIVSKNKKDVKAYEKLGELYFQNKNYDQSEEIYRHLIKLKSAGKKVKKGEQNEAEIEYLISLGIDSKIAVYYENLGQIYEITEKWDKALDSYLKCSAIDPNNPKYLDRLIDLGIKQGDRGLAKKSYHRLKEINPENGKLPHYAGAIEKIN